MDAALLRAMLALEGATRLSAPGTLTGDFTGVMAINADIVFGAGCVADESITSAPNDGTPNDDDTLGVNMIWPGAWKVVEIKAGGNAIVFRKDRKAGGVIT